MGILRNASSALSYTRVEEWDQDEKRHRQAQFLIYKNLQQVDRVIGGFRGKPASRSGSLLLRLRLSKLRVKIGRRLMRLRKTVVFRFTKARVSLCRQVSGRFKVWGRLFHGGAAVPSAALPQPLVA